MQLTILGSGSPEAYARRASSGYLIEVGQDKILLDCGGGVVDNLLRSGRSVEDITHVFFTHFHSDHMMDYARLVHAAWDAGAAPLKVFGPSPMLDIHESFFGPNGVLRHDLRARTELPASQQVWVARGGTLPRSWPAPEVTEIGHDFTYAGSGWRLRTARATHAQPFLECLAFAIDSDGKSFVYSGDTGINDEVTELCRDASFLLHWCYRGVAEQLHDVLMGTTPDPVEIAEMATRADVQRLWLTHFRVHMDATETHERALAAMAEKFKGEVGIVEDLDTFHI